MNGAQAIIRALEAEGVDTIFGYPGGSIMPFYDALIDSGIRHILCRHEQAAALAADGYARASGRVGVCVATSGPGATNLVTGIANAQMDSVPVLAITGQVPTAMIGTDAFQETDVLGLSLAVTKHSYLVERAQDLPRILAEALSLCRSGRPGPVWVDIPKDLQLAQVDDVSQATPSNTGEGYRVDESALAEGRALLRASKRPIIYAGGGVGMAYAVAEFREFVNTTGIPTTMTLKGIGNLPGNHRSSLGMLGMHGEVAANDAVQACDLLICVGARFDDRATGKLAGFATGAKVIHMDVDPAEVGKLRVPQVALLGDLRSHLRALSTPLDIAPWRNTCRRRRDELAHRYTPTSHGVNAANLVKCLSDAAGEDAFVCCDVGQHQMWVAQHYCFHHPRQHLSSGGLGAMGYGLPAAIGAQFAHPKATVINVAGDGSFMMNLQELATLKRYGLPVKIVILDNQRLGMVRQQQELFYKQRYSEVCLDDNPDFVQVAQAFGIAGRRLEAETEMGKALEEMLASPGPYLLHVPIAEEDNVWPIVPPGASNDEMIKEKVA